MAFPSCTYIFTNGTTSDATQVNQNFTDLINGLSDGTKTLNISVITVSGAVTYTGLSPSQAVFTNASKVLVSNPITGTGNGVMSASPTITSPTISSPTISSPTITGTIAGASQTLSGTLGVTGVSTFTAAPVFSSVTASLPLFTNGSNALVSNPITGTGNGVMSNSPTLTGTILGANQTLSGVLSASGGLHRSSNLTIDGIVTDKGYGIFGASAGTQIQIDDNEIQAMNGNSPSQLVLNQRGGPLLFGTTTSPTSKSQFQSGIQFNVYNVPSATITLDSSNYYIYCNTSVNGAMTVTLPAAASNAGLAYFFDKVGASTNTLTIQGNGAELVGTANTVILGGNVMSRLSIICNGTGWSIIELYEEGTYTATLTGCTTIPTQTISYVRNGKAVSIRMNALVGTSNTTACTITGMPSHIWPATFGSPTIQDVRDNSLQHIGVIIISNAGVWSPSFYNAITTQTTTFTNAGTKGIGQLDLTYSMQ